MVIPSARKTFLSNGKYTFKCHKGIVSMYLIWVLHSQDDMLIVCCCNTANKNRFPVLDEFRRVLELPLFTKSLFSPLSDLDRIA